MTKVWVDLYYVDSSQGLCCGISHWLR